MRKTRSRVAVTGLGAVTALGQDITETFSKLLGGVRAFGEIGEFDVSSCRIRTAAEIKNFRVSDVAPAGRAALHSRADALAIAAAEAAVREACIGEQDLYLAVGGTGGGMREAEPGGRLRRGGRRGGDPPGRHALRRIRGNAHGLGDL